MLRATTACTCSTSPLPRNPQFFTLLTWKCASRHVHFFDISTSKSGPRPLVLGNVLRATTACTFSTSPLPKVVRGRQFLTLLTWKCSWRHNGVHFFDISTSKFGPRPSVFDAFDFELCLAPQRRAIFYLKVQDATATQQLGFVTSSLVTAPVQCHPPTQGGSP